MGTLEGRCFLNFNPRPPNRVTFDNQADFTVFEIVNGSRRQLGVVKAGKKLTLNVNAGRLFAEATDGTTQTNIAPANGTIIIRPSPKNEALGLGRNEKSPIFVFPYQMTSGWGRETKIRGVKLMNIFSSGSQDVVTSIIDDPLSVDLNRSVTIMGWLAVADMASWRTFISIESPDCKTSLLNAALSPNSMALYFAYMMDAERRDNVFTEVAAPGLKVYFHLALTLDGEGVTIYMNGNKSAVLPLKGSLFNPDNKRVVLGSTKFHGRGVAQWNGQIRDVKIFDEVLTGEEVMKEYQATWG